MNKQVLIIGSVALLAAVVAVGAVFLTTPTQGPAEQASQEQEELQTITEYERLKAQLERDGVDTLTDTDGDGLPDALENFVYGSDPNAYSTTGNGIPDGWFAPYGYDPTQPGVEKHAAAVPPGDEMPEVYQGEWPDRYRWSLEDVYFYAMPANWSDEALWNNGLDPREWRAAPEGLPTSWLVVHFPATENEDDGELSILEAGLSQRSLTDDGFTVSDNYEHDTDPHVIDTDRDGLSDPVEVRTHGSDPREYSTSGTGIPDGWLVHHQLDPLDRMVGTLDPAGKGLTIQEVWVYNLERFGEEAAIKGDGLDPNEMSEREDAVPDGWLVGHGLDPLQDDVATREVQCASDYEHVRHLPGQEDVPEGLDALVDLCLSVEDAYLYARPSDWSEKDDGPWSGGLDPAEGDQDGDALPDAVEIRGWFVERNVDLGPGGQAEWNHVASDPRKADTDGDGLTDREEYHGEAERDGVDYVFPVTDPSNPDTAFSGMSDAEKVFGSFGGESWDLHEETDDGALKSLLDPTRRDTAGDYLGDGDGVAYWLQARENVRLEGEGVLSYRDVYPGSKHESYLDWINRLDWVGSDLDHDQAMILLGPDGDVDDDGVANLVDPFASGDNLRNGWQVDPSTLGFSDFPAPSSSQPRSPIDPANRDTSGDQLDDEWKLRHGEWDPSLDGGSGGWDLDPAKWDSNGDGESDAKGNLDGDVIVWYAYSSGEREPPNDWAYNNLREFTHETDPRVPDQNGNGVTEGWAVFWGSEQYYAHWVRQAQSESPPKELGDVVPDPTSARFSQTQQEIGNPLNEEVGTRVKDELGFYRFLVEPDPSADQLNLDDRFDEGYEEGWPQEVDVIRDGEVVKRRVGWIEGTYRHTHADDQKWGLNPYLEDTTGDGIRDAWAAYYANHCNIDPASPRIADEQGPGRSGLTMAAEYGNNEGDRSTDPCEADTDLDGIDDGSEREQGLNPVDPRDASLIFGDAADSDGDGLPDADELLDGTDPMDPDTDRDGLMDGFDLPCRIDLVNSDRCLVADSDFGADERAALKALGVAHKRQSCAGNDNQNGPYCFFGERPRGTGSLEATSRLGGHSGIPDGWAAYYERSSTSAQLEAAYGCSKPDWWDESRLGVWWWGLEQTGECPRDRDRDGLGDYNGEDAVAGASQSNRAAGVDLPGLMDNGSVDRLELVRAAQGWGECAGNPHDVVAGDSCFDDWEHRWQNELEGRFVPVKISNVEIDGLTDDTVKKQQEFEVSGRLLVDFDDCAPGACPVAAHRSVVLRLWDTHDDGDPLDYDIASDVPGEDGVTLGVAFTDENGDFTVKGCLCTGGGTIDVPDGMVALGRSNTTATWSPPAAQVAAGSSWELGVHVYATTATYWGDPGLDDETHPQYLEINDDPSATMSLWEPLQTDPVQVTSDTVLSIDAPELVAWGEQERVLAITVDLHDLSEGPVADQTVQVSMGDLSRTGKTNGQGTLRWEPDVGARTGSLMIEATYNGNDTLGGAQEDQGVTLQGPLELEGPTTEIVPVRLGQATAFSVQVSSKGDPVAGVTVSANLGQLSVGATTNNQGEATVSLSPPVSMDPGPTQITFSVSASDAYESAVAVQPVSLVSGSLLQASVPELGSLGAPLPFDGRLMLTDGSPLAGETVRAEIAGHELGGFVTDEGGRFEGSPEVPLEVPVGQHDLRLWFEGEPDVIDAVSMEKPVRFSIATQLILEEVHGGRGQSVPVKGGLSSVTGHALVGETVNLTLPWGESVEVLVRSGGQFTLLVLIPEDQALGVFQVNASYLGSVNETFSPDRTQAGFIVGAPSQLEVDALGVLHRGNNTITVRLLDEETGEPIPGAPIRVTMSFAEEEQMVRTGGDGRVRFQLEVDRGVDPGPINLTFMFDGDDRYAPAQSDANGVLRVPARLAVSVPGELGRGTQHVFEATLMDDRGVPLPGRSVEFEALGSFWNVSTDSEGKLTTRFDLSLEASLGEGEVRMFWGGDEAHDGVSVVRGVVVKDGVHVRVEGVPEEVRAGDRITLEILVEDTSGNPVQSTLAIRIDQVPGSMFVETDERGLAELPFVVPDGLTDSFRLSVRFPGTNELAARTEVFEPRLVTASADHMEQGGRLWIALTAGVSAAGVAGAAAFLVVRYKRGNQIAEILEGSRKRIEAGDPWTGAVLLAYQQLVEHLHDHGVEDAEAGTPRAFAQHLVDTGVMGQVAAAQLVSLFERARYAEDEELSKEDALRARQILSETVRAVEGMERRKEQAAAR